MIRGEDSCNNNRDIPIACIQMHNGAYRIYQYIYIERERVRYRWVWGYIHKVHIYGHQPSIGTGIRLAIIASIGCWWSIVRSEVCPFLKVERCMELCPPSTSGSLSEERFEDCDSLQFWWWGLWNVWIISIIWIVGICGWLGLLTISWRMLALEWIIDQLSQEIESWHFHSEGRRRAVCDLSPSQ